MQPLVLLQTLLDGNEMV